MWRWYLYIGLTLTVLVIPQSPAYTVFTDMVVHVIGICQRIRSSAKNHMNCKCLRNVLYDIFLKSVAINECQPHLYILQIFHEFEIMNIYFILSIRERITSLSDFSLIKYKLQNQCYLTTDRDILSLFIIVIMSVKHIYLIRYTLLMKVICI